MSWDQAEEDLVWSYPDRMCVQAAVAQPGAAVLEAGVVGWALSLQAGPGLAWGQCHCV